MALSPWRRDESGVLGLGVSLRDTGLMRTELDNDRLGLTVLGLYKIKEGEVASAVIHLGRRLGLFGSLHELGSASPTELADATGYHERWVREWLYAMGALDLVQHDDGVFALTPEAVVALVDDGHPQHLAGVFGPPITGHEIDRTVEAFSTGIGMTWGEHGADTCHFQAAMGASGQRAFLVPVILDSVSGLRERLSQGGNVVDIGCGSGVAATAIAEAFPKASVIGMDPSEHAIETARGRAKESGLTNLSFRHGTFDDLAELDAPVDLLLTLDVIHDLPRPGAAVRSARACLADDGVWMVADMKTRGGLEENRKIPVLPMMYSMSILYCMSSAMSEPGGAGLGTLGLTAEVLTEMADAAGFGSVESREFDIDPMNRYYELRP